MVGYLRDVASAQEQTVIEAHLEDCTSCESKFRRILTVDDQDLAPPDIVGFEPIDFVAAGGMGIVWLMLETELQRLVAVKIAKTRLAEQDTIVRRFVAEAQICGQLAHPAIVPIHKVGRLKDGRPYYAMKYIEGRTLADILLPGEDRPQLHQFLRMMAVVTQAIGYAHGKGVIHRDLKPRNIMVGRHGEVQVTDWGLAKSLRHGADHGDSDDIVATPARTEMDETLAENALGTYAYMAPEQHRNPTKADYAADVFSLGTILGECIIGAPPFEAPTAAQGRARSRAEQLIEYRRRIEQAEIESELKQLVLDCLAEEPDHRPTHASRVADRLEAYLSGVERRLEQERLLGERQRVELEEQRKRSRLRVSLAGLAACLAAVLGIGAFSWQRQQTTRDRELALTTSELALAAAAFERADPETTNTLLARAEARLNAFPDAQAREELSRLTRATTLVARLKRIQAERTSPRRDGLFDNEAALRNYAAAFEAFGVDMLNAEPTDLHRELQAGGVAESVLSPLDNWATVCMYRTRYDPQNADRHRHQRNRLLQLGAMICNSDVDNALRDPEVWDDPEQLKLLAQNAVVRSDLSPELASLLAELLRFAGGDPEALLRHYQARYRNDFWLNFNLARWLLTTRPRESIPYHHAALSLRPENVILTTNLGTAHLVCGETGEARQYFELALKHYPGFVPAQVSLYAAEAETDLDSAIRRIEALQKELKSANLDSAFAVETLAELRAQKSNDGVSSKPQSKSGP